MIDVPQHHLETIKSILAALVPGKEVRAFGSRVGGIAKTTSDLDIAVVGEGKLNRRTKMLLREAFEESNLPFRVDVLDYNAISAEFRTIVEGRYEVIQKSGTDAEAGRN
jgi:predicted nucleotidyltransferase